MGDIPQFYCSWGLKDPLFLSLRFSIGFITLIKIIDKSNVRTNINGSLNDADWKKASDVFASENFKINQSTLEITKIWQM